MLPSKGFFSNSLCPSYSRRDCSRPYCHYRHSRERNWAQAEKNEEFIKKAIENEVKELSCREISGQLKMDTVINNIMRDIKHRDNFERDSTLLPSYNPTPISELNRRQIPVVLPLSKPTYSNMVRKKNINDYRKSDLHKNSSQNPGNLCNSITGRNLERKLHSQPNFTFTSTESFSAPDLRYFSNTDNSQIIDSTDMTLDERMKISPDKRGHCTILSTDKTKTTTQSKIDEMDNSNPPEAIKNISETIKANNDSIKAQNSIEIYKSHNRNQKKHLKNCGRPFKNKCKTQSSGNDDSIIPEKRKMSLEVESAKKSKLHDVINEFVANENTSEIYETIVISSASNSPTPEDDGIYACMSLQESPPPKRKKQSIAEVNVSPQESLCERWRKAREMIDSRNRSSSKLKIHPVANVHVLLKPRDVVMGRKGVEDSLDVSDSGFENNASRKIVRKSRIPLDTVMNYPNVIIEDNLKIPFYVRQHAIRNLFDEFCKYKGKTEAYDDSQKLEIELCRRVNITQTYKNVIAVAVLRIRKQKGLVFDRETPKELLNSNTIPDFTNGWSMYKCFFEYLLSYEQYKKNGFPMKIPSKQGMAYIEMSARRTKSTKPSDRRQQICDHCCRSYRVDKKGFPVEEFDCFYHWGKMRRLRACGGRVEKYTCCGGDAASDPCTIGKYHVCNLFDEDSLEGFVTTRPQRQGENSDAAGIYGIDCEMCYTTRGVELTRCTLVDLNGRTVYDKIVVPDNPIIDYCTRFSGITETMIKKSNLRLGDIQKDLLEMINEKTILVGHSLENDLKVLRIFHNSLVDTSVIFPHKTGLPLKLSLKKIAKDLLNLSIQENENGHDSYEDANACIQIMLWKIKEDSKKRKPRIIISLESDK